MTVSGSYAFDPTVAGVLDEAAEQAGIDPSTINERHVRSAKMSLNLMLTEWAVLDGDAIFRVVPGTQAVAAATYTFNLPSGAFDVTDMVMDYGNTGTVMPIKRISRSDYLQIAQKTTQDQPNRWYLDDSVLNTYTVTLWPVPDEACTFYFDYMRFSNTVKTLGETFDMQRLWLNALVSGLAARLALKYNLERYQVLQPIAVEAYRIARRAGSGFSQIIIQTRGFGNSGRTIRGVGVTASAQDNDGPDGDGDADG